MTGQAFHQDVQATTGLVDAMTHRIQFTASLYQLGTQLLVFGPQRLHQSSEFVHLVGEAVEVFKHAAIVSPRLVTDRQVSDGARGNS